jgi:predicted house-cleaning NTP pyrophosphatase (Maf/HAM1 superfamily)
MMQGLSNKWHKVYSAHNVVFNLEKQLTYSWVIEADVKFGEIPI